MRTKIMLAAATAALTVAATAMAAPGDRFAKLDTDNNGSVTLAEMNAQTATRFAKLDSDRDGFVTKAELAARREAMKAKWAEHADMHRAGHGEGHRRHGEPGDRMARRDADNDGRLSLAEFQAVSAQHFARLDADKNGAVTQAEVAAAHEARKARRQG